MKTAGLSRVLVWLDPTAAQEASLDVLAGLGPAVEIIRGLFVEDTTLLDLSRLPVACEITIEDTKVRQMEERNIEQQFRVHGARMRGVFESAAKKISASCSFKIARGELRSVLLSHSADFDMLVVAHSRYQFGPRLNVSAQLNELLTGGPPTLIFVQERWRTGQHVAVVFDGSSQSEAALRIAAAIAQSERQGLSIWLPQLPDEERRQLEAAALEDLGSTTDHVFRHLSINDVDELVRAANAENPRVMVLPDKEPDETQQLVSELLDRVNCSLIVAR